MVPSLWAIQKWKEEWLKLHRGVTWNTPLQPEGYSKPRAAPRDPKALGNTRGIHHPLGMGTDFMGWKAKVPGLCTEAQDWGQPGWVLSLNHPDGEEHTQQQNCPGPFWELHPALQHLRLWFVLFLQRGREPDLWINLPLPNFSLFIWMIS